MHMFGVLKRLATRKVAVAGALALGLFGASVSHADTISTTDTFLFSGPDSVASAGTRLDVSNGFLTFTPAPAGPFTTPAFPILGNFQETSTSSTAANLAAGDKFTITIVQTGGSSGTGTTQASVTGSIGISTGGTIVLNFSPNPIQIGNDLYTFSSYNIQFPTTSGVAGPSTPLIPTVTPLPLPATASTGLALMGGLGVLTGVNVLRRRRQMA
jgi:hypothetical protein